MAKGRVAAGLLAAWLLARAGGAWAAPDDAVVRMLGYKPKQEGVVYTTPSEKDQEGCKLVQEKGAWVVRDAAGKTLRRFADTNGDKKLDVSSYYLDGVEVYREIDSNYDGNVDRYRWFNAGGMKWGEDPNQDGKIDYWRMISAEEASQELLLAVATNDYARLQALFITDKEMEALGLPAAEVSRIHGLQQNAAAKFEATVRKLALSPQAKWERLEASLPQCLPAEQVGTKRDLIRYHRAMVLYENGGKHDWLQAGEMIQVGLAWRLTDAPGTGDATEGASQAQTDPALLALLEELKQLDKAAPAGTEVPGPNAALVSYNLRRADVLQRVLAKVKPEDSEQWTRQLADCLSAAAQSSPESDKAAYERLVQLEQQVAKDQPKSGIAAYVTFREMSAEYAGRLVGKQAPEFAKVQEQWLGRLTKFVQDYPQAEDTPDAILQLGMVSEFLGKEIEAKKWYQQLVTNFADKKPLAGTAEGALRRLDLEGKVLELSGNTPGGQPFTMSQLRGKAVVVYYWASRNQQSVGDFARLKVLLQKYAGKAELVSINLDNSPPEQGDAQRTAAPGVQLFAPGGLDSPLATQYGIMVLPNMFVVDADGKVVSRSAQIATLEDELKKALPK